MTVLSQELWASRSSQHLEAPPTNPSQVFPPSWVRIYPEPQRGYLDPSFVSNASDCLNPQDSWAKTAFLAHRAPSELLDAKELASDIVWLHGLLERHYSGWSDLGSVMDTNSFFSSWIGELHGRADIRLDEGVYKPFARLLAIHPDYHLGPVANKNSIELEIDEYVGKVHGSTLERCTLVHGPPEVFMNTLRSTKLIDIKGNIGEIWAVSGRGAAQSIELKCGSDTIHLSRRSRIHEFKNYYQGQGWEFTSIRGISVLRIDSFDSTLSQLPDSIPDLSAIHRLVIDMRGNGGGNYDPVFMWINRISDKSVKLGARSWSNTPCGIFNYTVISNWVGNTNNSYDLTKIRNELSTYTTPAPRNITGKMSSLTPFTGEAFVIVDRNSASASEIAISVFQQALGSISVGERTAGAIGYEAPTPYIMPRTGIAWSVPRGRWQLGQEWKGVGLPVDYMLDTDLLSRPVDEIVDILPWHSKEK